MNAVRFMYIFPAGTEVTSHRRPHADVDERRQRDPNCNLDRMAPGEPAPNLGGWRQAYEDEHGTWRLVGSDRAVAKP